MLLLGDGEIRNDLMQYAISKKIAEHVIFKGTVSNPYSYMKRSSVFVQTSSFEGLPTVLIEALACCCNIVCAESRGGAGEVLTDKVYGRIVPPDAQLLADAIIDSFGDKNNCDEKLKRAKDFGVEKAVEKYLELIGRLQ